MIEDHSLYRSSCSCMQPLPPCIQYGSDNPQATKFLCLVRIIAACMHTWLLLVLYTIPDYQYEYGNDQIYTRSSASCMPCFLIPMKSLDLFCAFSPQLFSLLRSLDSIRIDCASNEAMMKVHAIAEWRVGVIEKMRFY